MKKDIYHLPWDSETEELDPKLLKVNSSWILPQLTALLGKLPLARGDNELISPTLSLRRVAKEIDGITFSNGMPVSKEAVNAMLRYVLRNNRSDILSGTQLTTPRYSAAVPFVLSAFKEQRNIQYSSWDTTDPMFRFLIEDEWILALRHLQVPNFTLEERLDFRAKARTFKTGPKAGTMRTINTTTAISKLDVETFDELPKYWKLALCQTWVFHPSNRHPLAITNPYNIDEPAEPLVSGEIFETKQPAKAKYEPVDWDRMWDDV
jgi:hypothetical protein